MSVGVVQWLRRRRGARGASAVELALLTPLLSVLLVGAVQIGAMYTRSLELENVARDAARLASEDLDATLATIEQRATDGLDDPSGVVVTVTPAVDQPCVDRAGLPVSVAVRETHPLDVLFVTTTTVVLGAEVEFPCAFP